MITANGSGLNHGNTVFTLPILNHNAVIPTGISEMEVGRFLGGVVGYWIRVVKIMF